MLVIYSNFIVKVVCGLFYRYKESLTDVRSDKPTENGIF